MTPSYLIVIFFKLLKVEQEIVHAPIHVCTYIVQVSKAVMCQSQS